MPTVMQIVLAQRLSFGVPACSCFALLGPNGAGKTTSMSMLTGEQAAPWASLHTQALLLAYLARRPTPY